MRRDGLDRVGYCPMFRRVPQPVDCLAEGLNSNCRATSEWPVSHATRQEVLQRLAARFHLSTSAASYHPSSHTKISLGQNIDKLRAEYPDRTITPSFSARYSLRCLARCFHLRFCRM